MKPSMPSGTTLKFLLDALVLALVLYYIASYFSPQHLLSKTIATGGDTASHYYAAQYLKEYLLPHGKILGWMQGNFAGFPVFQFYFPMPFVLMVLLSYATGLQIAFKLISVLGIFLLPLCAHLCFRFLGFRFPTPSLAATFTLPFLFMEANSMWGGNIPSTLAGEFTYSIGLALMVLLAGSCYRGMLEQRWAVRNGVLLAVTGFCHGYTLLFAVAFSTYFLVALPGLARNLRYLAIVHGLAFCLMGFWIIPLLGYSPFTTRYNVVWVINSWQEILPPILWPSIVLAATFTLYKVARLIRPRWREPFDLHIGLLWYILGLSYLFFLTAFRIHVVDIRFLPFLQLFLCLLGAVPIGLLARCMKGGWMIVPIIALSTVLWTDHNVKYIRQWIPWNYSGFEGKTLWPAFSAVNKALKGTEAAPRVVYEHSAEHNAAGTVRAFESIPLFSGRNTLEGLYMQSSISSPFIFYIQSEISEVSSCALPDYNCATPNLQRGVDHLRLFNVSDFIVRSEAIKRAIRDSPDFEFRQSIPPYDVYRVKGGENRYVVPLQYEPVLLQTQDWKTDFYNWFRRPGTSSVHLVHLFGGTIADEKRFALKSSALPANITKQPLEGGVKITEEVSQEEIRITTNRVGHPLLVKVSYHPRWRVEGAEKIYLASPSFMLIYPNQTNVRLVFDDPPMVRFGQLLTILALCVVLVSWGPLRRRVPWLRAAPAAIEARLAATRPGLALAALLDGFDRRRKWMAPLVIATAGLGALILVFSLQQTDSSVLYNQGLEEFTKQRCDKAKPLFEQAMKLSPNAPSAINANYYYAICFYKERHWEKTIDLFEQLVARYPDSVYVPEAEFHIALGLNNLGRKGQAVAKFQSILVQHPASPWAGHTRTQLEVIARGAVPPGSVASALGAGPRTEFDAAMVLYDLNRLKEAGDAFRNFANKYPEDELADDASMYYCFSLFRREMYLEAIAELQIMVKRFPQSSWIPEARYHIGVSQMHLGQAQQATAAFEWVLKNAPSSRWAGFSREKLAEIKK